MVACGWSSGLPVRQASFSAVAFAACGKNRVEMGLAPSGAACEPGIEQERVGRGFSHGGATVLSQCFQRTAKPACQLMAAAGSLWRVVVVTEWCRKPRFYVWCGRSCGCVDGGRGRGSSRFDFGAHFVAAEVTLLISVGPHLRHRGIGLRVIVIRVPEKNPIPPFCFATSICTSTYCGE